MRAGRGCCWRWCTTCGRSITRCRWHKGWSEGLTKLLLERPKKARQLGLELKSAAGFLAPLPYRSLLGRSQQIKRKTSVKGRTEPRRSILRAKPMFPQCGSSHAACKRRPSLPHWQPVFTMALQATPPDIKGSIERQNQRFPEHYDAHTHPLNLPENTQGHPINRVAFSWRKPDAKILRHG